MSAFDLDGHEYDSLVDPFGADRDDVDLASKPATCKYCGHTGLSWHEHAGKWRLYDFDDLHRCKQYTQENSDDGT